MSDDSSFELAGFLCVGGATILWRSLKNKQRARRFEDVQTISIGSAPQGHVEVSGFAWAEALDYGVESRGGVFLEWQLEKLVSKGEDSEWVVVAKGKRPSGFLVGDDTAAAWVDMTQGELDSKQTYVSWKKATPQQRKVFQSWVGPIVDSSFPPSDTMFSTEYRMGIKTLPLGCPVVVQGHLTGLGAPKFKNVLKGYTAFREKYLKFKRNMAYQSSMFDVNHDGNICEDEHRTGHVYIANSLARKHQEDIEQVGVLLEEVALVGSISSALDEKVVVANTHEKYFIGRLRSFSTIGIVGGAAMMAAGVCLLYYEFLIRTD